MCADGCGEDPRICARHYESGEDSCGKVRIRKWVKEHKLHPEQRFVCLVNRTADHIIILCILLGRPLTVLGGTTVIRITVTCSIRGNGLFVKITPYCFTARTTLICILRNASSCRSSTIYCGTALLSILETELKSWPELRRGLL